MRTLCTLPGALRGQRRVFSNKVTVTHKICELEHGTLQLIDPEHLLEMRIQDIEELQAGQKKLRKRESPQSSRRMKIPLQETYSVREDFKRTWSRRLYSHVKNRVVTSEKAKSQRENESSLPEQPTTKK